MSRSWNKGLLWIVGFLIVMSIMAVSVFGWKISHGGVVYRKGQPQPLVEMKSSANIKSSYDVIVVGTDPEGVAAAVSASRNGLKTLLVDGKDRSILGGLMTLGWLNSLDMNYEIGSWPPKVMNRGIFSEWYGKIEGDSFDVTTAANAFRELVVHEKNIDVLMKTKSVTPALEGTVVKGAQIVAENGTSYSVSAKAVIDATQDADFAFAAGVPFTMYREDIADPKSRMAVTAVFKLSGVTPEVWKQFGKTIQAEDKGQGKYGINEMSLWGFDKMQEYPAVNQERVRMRGLNGGRQNDNTMLVNALQIFGVDPFDPKSRQEAFDIAQKELPHVLEYLRKQYPEFNQVELAAIAPELYVRETRHMMGEYRLTIADVLENRDQWDRIGFGGYPVDIQRTSPKDNGSVVTDPDKYAIPFRSIVPQKIDGLLVVGRSASFDTLPHGSARVIPVGMATGEAAGAAVKLANELGKTFRQLSADKEAIGKLQANLNSQGMDLKPYTPKVQPFMEHKAHAGLLTTVMLGLASGGYKNEFSLDEPSNVRRMANLVDGMKKFSPGSLSGSNANVVAGFPTPEKQPLTLDAAAQIVAATLKVSVPANQAAAELEKRGIITNAAIQKISNKQSLTNGETYMLVKDIAAFLKLKQQS